MNYQYLHGLSFTRSYLPISSDNTFLHMQVHITFWTIVAIYIHTIKYIRKLPTDNVIRKTIDNYWGAF